MPNASILTYNGNYLLGAFTTENSSDIDVLLGDGDGMIFGVAEPDAVLIWESMSLLAANDEGSLVLLGTSDDLVLGVVDVPAVLEWGGVVGA